MELRKKFEYFIFKLEFDEKALLLLVYRLNGASSSTNVFEDSSPRPT